MTNSAITGGLVLANTTTAILATAAQPFGIWDFLNAIQSGAAVASILGIFLWREVKKNEKLEKRLDEAQKRLENKCSSCEYVKAAKNNFLDDKDK